MIIQCAKRLLEKLALTSKDLVSAEGYDTKTKLKDIFGELEECFSIQVL